ncbi:MAG: LysR family transcriptional regulator [Nannocystaceae bacterium]|nr:LysR family transcriptional regulator [Nannocystaceae bacterium]
MELTQAKYFLAVVEARHFTRAAERCHVSQPALTSAIKKLEIELCGQLFHRDRRGAKLTTLGTLVLDHARKLVASSEAIAACAADYGRLKNVPLRVGVIPTIGPSRLAGYLEAYRVCAPSVELEICVHPHDQLMTRLEEADLEIAISNVLTGPPAWSVIKPVYRERYFVLLPPGHDLASRATVALADLGGERYIDRTACELRDEIAERCAQSNINLYAIYRTEREAWIECLVRAGIGFAFMPEYSILSNDAVKRALVEPEVYREISILRSAERPVSPAARMFWDTLVERSSPGSSG